MTTRFVAGSGGVRLALTEAGDGGTPLLLVHGFTGAKEDFTPLLPPLAAAGWHAVTFDHRGHGESEQPPDESAYSLEIMAADVDAVVDEFGWEHFALLGHSMGGMVAQLVALADHSRLDALVLMDTTHGPVHAVDANLVAAGQALVRRGGVEALLALSSEGDLPGATPADRALRAADPDYAAWCDRKLLSSSSAMVAAMLSEFVDQPDRLTRLGGLDGVPTLVIAGEQDHALLADSERMAETIPGARLAIVAGGGHCPQFEAPAEFWDALAGFLATVEPAPGA
jgi:pimeloyl-ACP methyl ester carboxylesterase